MPETEITNEQCERAVELHEAAGKVIAALSEIPDPRKRYDVLRGSIELCGLDASDLLGRRR